MSRDARARERAYLLDPEVMRKGSASAVRKLMDRALRGEQPKQAAPVPLVTARAPRGPDEFAAGRAVGIGQAAAARGMQVAPYYWKSGTCVEGCAVKGRGPALAFVATWERKPGTSWSFALAYVWNPGDRSTGPVKVNYGELERVIRERG